MMQTPAPRASRYGLPAALVRERHFTWAITGVTAGLLGMNALGLSLWQCPFRRLTGLPCPGCGLTRSCLCLLRGEVAHSLSYHLFGPLLFAVGLMGFAGSLLPDKARLRLTLFLQHWDEQLAFSRITFWALAIYSLTRWFLPG